MEKEVEACKTAESEIGSVDQGGKVRAIFDSDEGLAYYRAKAEEASRKAEDSREAAEAACAELRSDWREARDRWQKISRAMANRRGEEDRAPQEVPLPDFPEPVATASAHRHPWPGGVRPPSTEQRPAAPTRRATNRERLLSIKS